MGKRETRRGVGEVRAVTEEGGVRTVTLHCIRPGVVDDYGSLWMADTFDESLAERLPTLCWSHDWSDPLGSGVDFRTSADGPDVIFEFDDFDAVPMARRAWAQCRPKANGGPPTIRDCSVGFSNAQRRDPTEAERKQYPGIREVIYKADLDEVSLVLRGAVPGAKVLAVRDGEVVSKTVAAQIITKLGAGDIDLADALTELKRVAIDDPDAGGDEKTPEELAAEAAAQAEQEAAEKAEVEALEAEADEALAAAGLL